MVSISFFDDDNDDDNDDDDDDDDGQVAGCCRGSGDLFHVGEYYVK